MMMVVAVIKCNQDVVLHVCCISCCGYGAKTFGRRGAAGGKVDSGDGVGVGKQG